VAFASQHHLNNPFLQVVIVNIRCSLETTLNKPRIVGEGGAQRGIRLNATLVILIHFSLLQLSLFVEVFILEHMDITLIINECWNFGSSDPFNVLVIVFMIPQSMLAQLIIIIAKPIFEQLTFS
jgi:hypothetical protein